MDLPVLDPHNRVVSVLQMRQIEADADRAGVTYEQMMETAGTAVANRVLEHLKGQTNVLILIGSGNNGGDGLVVARLLAEQGKHVQMVLTKERDTSDSNWTKVHALEIPFLVWSPSEASKVQEFAATAAVIVDALLGTGATIPLRPAIASLLQAVKRGIDVQTIPPIVIAVDLPSGLDANTGDVAPETLSAMETVTFEALKIGLIQYPGATKVGTIAIASLQLPESLPSRDKIRREYLRNASAIDTRLPKRPANSNKGTFGKTLIVAGSRQYIGAAALSARAAYAVGTGLVAIATPAPNVSILAGQLLEAIWFPLADESGAIEESTVDLIWEHAREYSALLIGPGLGQAKPTKAFIDLLFSPELNADPLPQTYPDPPPPSMMLDPKTSAPKPQRLAFPPLVLDADALNILAELENWHTRLPGSTILTPHPGEMARLCGLSTKDVQANRVLLAEEKAKAWNCIVVLKGANTVIAAPDGRTAIAPFATSALAKAGTGDVLAGMITGLLAQGLDPYESAIIGTFLHGKAGLLAGQQLGEASTLASDLIRFIGAAIDDV